MKDVSVKEYGSVFIQTKDAELLTAFHGVAAKIPSLFENGVTSSRVTVEEISILPPITVFSESHLSNAMNKFYARNPDRIKDVGSDRILYFAAPLYSEDSGRETKRYVSYVGEGDNITDKGVMKPEYTKALIDASVGERETTQYWMYSTMNLEAEVVTDVASEDDVEERFYVVPEGETVKPRWYEGYTTQEEAIKAAERGLTIDKDRRSPRHVTCSVESMKQRKDGSPVVQVSRKVSKVSGELLVEYKNYDNSENLGWVIGFRFA